MANTDNNFIIKKCNLCKLDNQDCTCLIRIEPKDRHRFLSAKFKVLLKLKNCITGK
ncbi:unnamed protein product [Moneuplotes crassus]|uniref:Uncharacterized protein n=1 Tax=Euplotes crassus TaxID=5936 RepID=A0AAD2D1M7_EUPCR|nr:unnamed protein product [Moneuplotes crassus]